VALFSRHRSYTEKVLAKRRRIRTLGKIVLFFLLLGVMRTFFIQSFTLRSTNMEPSLYKGDSLLSFPLPLGAKTLFGKLPPLSNLRRGELVLVDPDPVPNTSWAFRTWDSLARFFTLQRYSPSAERYGKNESSPGVYRVIALPGDKIRQRNFVYEIQTGSGGAYLTEHSLASSPYTLRIPEKAEAPALALMQVEEMEMGPGEYFVACDDRSYLGGSALWGPVGIQRISGRIIAVFWPFRHFRFL